MFSWCFCIFFGERFSRSRGGSGPQNEHWQAFLSEKSGTPKTKKNESHVFPVLKISSKFLQRFQHIEKLNEVQGNSEIEYVTYFMSNLSTVLQINYYKLTLK